LRPKMVTECRYLLHDVTGRCGQGFEFSLEFISTDGFAFSTQLIDGNTVRRLV
jgi:hypothetical protein